MRFLRSVFAGSVVIVSSHAAASDQCLELCASATVKGVLGCKEVYESERRLAGERVLSSGCAHAATSVFS